MDAADQVKALYEAYQARDWDRATELLHPDASVELPATGERLTGRAQVVDFQVSYPEPWGEMRVLRVLGGGEGEAAAEVQVIDPDLQRFGNAAFWRQRDGLLHEGVEYWVTVGSESPPDTRKGYYPDDQSA